MLDINLLKQYLDYNPNTGIFTWKISPSQSVKKGDIAGTINAYKYLSIAFKGKIYKAHRLAWIMTYNKMPNIIDHINGNKLDNRIKNLRSVNTRQNSQNKKVHRDGKLYGTYDISTKSYKAQIQINGKNIHIGRFKTETEAHNAYLKKVKELKLDN